MSVVKVFYLKYFLNIFRDYYKNFISLYFIIILQFFINFLEIIFKKF